MRILATIILACVALAAFASRQFTETSGQFMARTTAPVSTYPCTISVWYKPSNNTSNQSIVYLGSATDQRRFLIYRTSSVSNNFAAMDNRSNGGAVIQIIVSTTQLNSSTTWYHVVGVYASATDRKLYVNGVFEASDTNSMTTTSLDKMGIGARAAPAPSYGLYANAKIAEVAIWNVALSSAEILSLAKGANPQAVQPAALKSYIPLCTGLSPDIDFLGGTIGLTNSPSASVDHPPVFR